MYNSYWESIDECRKDIVKNLRAAYANRKGKCSEIDGDDILGLCGCIPMNVCLGYDTEKPFSYSIEDLFYFAELLESVGEERCNEFTNKSRL